MYNINLSEEKKKEIINRHVGSKVETECVISKELGDSIVRIEDESLLRVTTECYSMWSLNGVTVLDAVNKSNIVEYAIELKSDDSDAIVTSTSNGVLEELKANNIKDAKKEKRNLLSLIILLLLSFLVITYYLRI